MILANRMLSISTMRMPNWSAITLADAVKAEMVANSPLVASIRFGDQARAAKEVADRPHSPARDRSVPMRSVRCYDIS
ncbi:hypothetical protein TSH64_05340 [Azospirillum sp. TSH64]|nr:hypothetical protein TSH64_05340 [Azospirillum sp. TSH64]